jgi:molecular chaperone DnaJ
VSKRDYYEVLGVPKTAGDQQIKSAYRKLALQHHPDRNQGNEGAEEKFKEAAEAYAILSDGEKRAKYDRFGHAGVSSQAGAGFDPSTFAGFEDIFGGIFGDFFGGGRRGGPERGSDLRYDLEISFEESAKGAEMALQIPRQEQCETCRGSGAAEGSKPTTCPQCQGRGQLRYQQGFFTVARTCGQCRGTGTVIAKPCLTCKGAGRVQKERKLTVRIPPGIASGQRLRLTGEGEAGPAGGPAGDLYVVVHVQEHAFFQREGNDLYCEVLVSYPKLALGGEIAVPTLDGNESLRIPESTQTGTTFRLRGKGMPDVSNRGRGDLQVTVKVEVPRKLSKDQRRLLEELAATLPAEPAEPRTSEHEGDDKGLFDRVKDIFG